MGIRNVKMGIRNVKSSSRLKIKIGIILMFIMLLPQMEVYAEQEETQVCNVTIKYTEHQDAEYLYNGKYNMTPFKLLEKGGNVEVPRLDEVNYAVGHLLRQLHNEGVNVENFAKEGLSIEIVNAELEGLGGHAFVVKGHNAPTIYIYGKTPRGLIINGSMFIPSQIHALTLHEIAHYVELEMSTQEWNEYIELREIPSSLTNNSVWHERPREIFAEDFSQAFHPRGAWTNRGALGVMNNKQVEEFKSLVISSLKRDQPAVNNFYPCEQTKSLEDLIERSHLHRSDYIKSLSESKFKDVNKDDYYFSAVHHLEKLGKLTVNKEFSPKKDITRLETGELLHELLELKSSQKQEETIERLNGVSGLSRPQQEVVASLIENGIMIGDHKGDWGAEASLTREQMASVFVRAFNLKGKGEAQDSFVDINKSSSYHREDIEILHANNIVIGVGEGLFNPKGNMSRGQFAVMLDRILVNEGFYLTEEEKKKHRELKDS